MKKALMLIVFLFLVSGCGILNNDTNSQEELNDEVVEVENGEEDRESYKEAVRNMVELESYKMDMVINHNIRGESSSYKTIQYVDLKIPAMRSFVEGDFRHADPEMREELELLAEFDSYFQECDNFNCMIRFEYDGQHADVDMDMLDDKDINPILLFELDEFFDECETLNSRNICNFEKDVREVNRELNITIDKEEYAIVVEDGYVAKFIIKGYSRDNHIYTLAAEVSRMNDVNLKSIRN